MRAVEYAGGLTPHNKYLSTVNKIQPPHGISDRAL